MVGPIQQLPINQYDIRKKCDRNKNPLCYEEMAYVSFVFEAGVVLTSASDRDLLEQARGQEGAGRG
jgi:hypothetical protein